MYKQEQINPYHQEGEKSQQVEAMFDGIAPTYDLLNHLLSLGIDRGWRRKSVDSLKEFAPQRVLDLACGTGDFTALVQERLHPQYVIGSDLSDGMLAVARNKFPDIEWEKADALNLPHPDNSFDAVTMAYGVRNFQDFDAGLREMYRVLKPGGHLLIVELATPPHFPMKQLFWLYSHVVMPSVGWLVSRDSRAYSYLPATMEAFPQAEIVENTLNRIGFCDIRWKRFTFGLCTMFLAQK